MNHHAWTTTQINLLKVLYPVASRQKLIRELHPHPIKSICVVANMLGLRRRRDWQAIAREHKPVFNFETRGSGA